MEILSASKKDQFAPANPLNSQSILLPHFCPRWQAPPISSTGDSVSVSRGEKANLILPLVLFQSQDPFIHIMSQEGVMDTEAQPGDVTLSGGQRFSPSLTHRMTKKPEVRFKQCHHITLLKVSQVHLLFIQQMVFESLLCTHGIVLCDGDVGAKNGSREAGGSWTIVSLSILSLPKRSQ